MEITATLLFEGNREGLNVEFAAGSASRTIGPKPAMNRILIFSSPWRLIKLSASNGENDEFVFVPPLIFVIVVEVILLIRMSFNSARTPLRSTDSGSPEN
jgi:hypothetical protein